MKNDKFIFIFAGIITLILGPGVGHLFIKQWRKAAYIMIIAFILFLILTYHIVSAVGQDVLNTAVNFKNIEQFTDIYSKFQENNSNIMLIFNLFLAALWTYSVADIFMLAKKRGIFTKLK